MVMVPISALPGAVKVRSRPIERRVRFATADGICQTLEGPVRYYAGDALVEGSANEQWPVSRPTFDAAYEPVEGLREGADGLYRKIPQDGYAIQLSTPQNFPLGGVRGQLVGKPGDWIVDQGGSGLSLVAKHLFPLYYALVP